MTPEDNVLAFQRSPKGVEQPGGEDSRRFQPPNLGKAVREAVGEMRPYPAPLLTKAPETGPIA